jgi:hypothetical protein
MGQKERTERWKEKDPVAFYRSARKRTRNYLANPEGRAANREAVVRYRRNNREELLDKARARRSELRRLVAEHKDSPCLDCGRRYPAVCMDFDHRPGEVKRFNIAAGVGQSQTPARMLSEIAKFDLVCANCHRIRTARRHAAGETAVPAIAKPRSNAKFRPYVAPVPMEKP